MNHLVKLDITVAPLGTETPSISHYVVACEKVLKRFPEVEAHLNPMSTTLLGTLDQVLEVAKAMHEAPFQEQAKRVVTSMRLDDRRDKPTETMLGKVEKVKQQTRA